MVLNNNTAGEQHLLEALKRIEASPKGFQAIHFNFSKLQPLHKNKHQITVLSKLFEPLILKFDCRIFILSNSDIVLIAYNLPKDNLGTLIIKIKGMLSGDPLIYNNSQSSLFEFYQLEQNYSLFYNKIRKIYQISINPKDRNIFNDEIKKETLNFADLECIINSLENMPPNNFINFIKKQSAIFFASDDNSKTFLHEFFTSIPDFNEEICPKVNLFSNPWLFGYLSKSLDIKMLKVLSLYPPLLKSAPIISLNLNTSTILTPLFADFAKLVSNQNRKLIIEFQLHDILDDTGLYFEAKKIINKFDHKVLIDNISPITAEFSNLNALEANFFKIFWNNKFLDPSKDNKFKKGIENIGFKKIILARVESKEGLEWGHANKIRAFQGYYIDNFAVNFIKENLCPEGKICKSQVCLNTRAFLSPKRRKICKHPEYLDKMPNFSNGE